MKNEQYEKFLKNAIHVFSTLDDDIQDKPLTTTVQKFWDAVVFAYRESLEKFQEIPDKHTADSWLIFEDETTGKLRVFYGNADEVMYMACKIEIWGDCSREHVEKLYINGEECEPPTWEPDMIRRITRKRDGGEIFCHQFSNWDH